MPDRIVVTPTAGTVFVEVKKPGEAPDARQRVTHAKMRRFGAQIHVVDDQQAVESLMARLLAGDGEDGEDGTATTDHREVS